MRFVRRCGRFRGGSVTWCSFALYLGFDYAAIADTLGIKVGTVSATLHNANANLRRALTEEVRQ